VREPDYRAFLDAPEPQRSARLQQQLLDRVGFEALLEFGYSARVGRSLEKVGCAALSLDPVRLDVAVASVTTMMEADAAPLFGPALVSTSARTAAVRQFVLGLLHRLIWRGGVFHPWLKSYCDEGGNGYLLHKRFNRLIPPIFGSKRAPAFATLDPSSTSSFEKWVPQERWTQVTDQVARCFGGLDIAGRLDGETRTLVALVWRNTARLLLDAGLLGQFSRREDACLGVTADSLHLSREVHLLRCSRPGCGHALTVAPSEVSSFLARSCVRFRCRGHYVEDRRQEQVFYRNLYTTGDLKRVFGAEHTGLLTRAAREETERGFQQGVPADAPNLLTATSTLEMGIDIGDLSATLLSGVPPTVASFVQRAGRAGRSTGNAVIVTQARTKAQDLYFYDEPLDMVAGQITAPGTFLNAPEMLVRQFFAWSLDQWAQTDNARIPHDVAGLLSAAKGAGSAKAPKQKKFPVDFLDHLEAHREVMLQRFCALFEGEITSENEARLRVAAGELRATVLRHLEGTATRVDELRKLLESLKKKAEGVEGDVTRTPEQRRDDARDFRQDEFQLKGRIKRLTAAWSLDWFVDHGFLPNYALSEPGVTLNAVISGVPSFHRTADGQLEAEERFEEHSWRRPASLALRELAPFNHFHASGRRVVVDRVAVGTRTHSRIEEWVFCGSCSYCAPANEVTTSSCPDCRASGLGETGQRRQVVKLVEVSARMPHDESQLLDVADERERTRFRLVPLYRVAKDADRQAFADERRGFGYEWIGRMILRELNLGLEGRSDRQLRLHGDDVDAPGFRVCDDCGVALDPRDPRARPRHIARCKARREPEPKWRDVFLYREVESEAIRVLVPAAIDTDRRLANFRAALHLGLRLKFGGNPGHLIVQTMSEPAEGMARRHFLVISDAVPGGTGYLKELVRREGAFLELFRLALERLRACPCRRGGVRLDDDDEPGRDGCYRCLFGRESIDGLKLLSKRDTIDLLTGLLDGMELHSVETLSDVAVAQVADSELERRFLDRFIATAKQSGFVHEQATVSGWLCHTFRRGQEHLTLKPQIKVDHVDVWSQPDFMLEQHTDADGHRADRRRVAIFCDGYSIHAQQKDGTSLIAADIRKRTSLLRGGHRVWSIAWDDLEGDTDKARQSLLATTEACRAFDKMASLLGQARLAGLWQHGSLRQLMDLAFVDDDTWRAIPACLFAGLAASLTEMGESSWQAQRSAALPKVTASNGPWRAVSSTVGPVAVAVAVPGAVVRQFAKQPGALEVVLGLDDRDEVRAQAEVFAPAWHRFWMLANLLQGAQVGTWRSASLVAAHHDPDETATHVVPSTGWVADVPEELRAFARTLSEAGVSEPELLADVGPERGANWGQAELMWLEAKVAVLHPDYAHDFNVDAARSAGWIVVVGAEVDVAGLCATIKGERDE
jgi:DEAD/DEAH box helicase domain-containing protein